MFLPLFNLTIILLAISISYNSLVSAKCTYSIDEIKITEFTSNSDSLYQNSLNLTQGTTPGLTVYNLDNSSFPVSAQITTQDATSAWFTSLDACSGGRINSSFEYLQIVVKKPFLISLTIKARSRRSCDPVDDWTESSFKVLGTDFEPLSGDTFAVQIPLKQMEPSSISSAALLSEIAITRMSPIGRSLNLVSISALSVAATCNNVKPSIPGMAWKNDSALMVDDKPYFFSSFKVSDLIFGYNELEINDLIKTISIFANGTRKVANLHGIVKTCTVSGCKDRLVTGLKTYNEEILKRLDLILYYARKYQVRLGISFINMYGDMDDFCKLTGCALFDEESYFYRKRSTIDAFKHVIAIIITRNNTLTGVPYRNDPYILYWSIGNSLVTKLGDDFPPLEWLSEISSHIKQLDSNHLVSDGFSRTYNKRFAHFPMWSMENIDIHAHDYYDIHKYNYIGTCLRARVTATSFKKIFLVQQLTAINNESVKAVSDLVEGCFGDRFLIPDSRRIESGSGIFFHRLFPHLVLNINSDFSGFRYPGSNFSVPYGQEIMYFIRKSAAILKAIEEGPTDVSNIEPAPVPRSDAPRILNVTLVGIKEIEINWFGSTGSVEYTISKSFNNISFFNETPVHFVLSKPIIDSLDPWMLSSSCPVNIYYKLVARNSKYNWEADPGFGVITILNTLKVCLDSSSTSDSSDTISTSNRVIVLLVIGLAAFAVLTSGLLVIWYHRRKERKRRRGGMEQKSIAMETSSSNILVTGQKAVKGSKNNRELSLGADFFIHTDQICGSSPTAKICRGTLCKRSLISKYKDDHVAVKCFFSDQGRVNFLNEVAILSILPASPNIVQWIGFSQGPSAMSIVMRYYKCSLKDLIENSRLQMDSGMISKISLDISNGMAFIHDSGVLHLDLKPHNVLIDIRNDMSFFCVICDFGVSSIIGKEIRMWNKKNDMKGFTARYGAPEVFQTRGLPRLHLEIDKKIDVYAWAITMFEVFHRRYAWERSSSILEIKEAVASGARPQWDDLLKIKFDSISWLIDAVILGWSQDPKDRPHFQDIVSKTLEEERKSGEKSLSIRLVTNDDADTANSLSFTFSSFQ